MTISVALAILDAGLRRGTWWNFSMNGATVHLRDAARGRYARVHVRRKRGETYEAMLVRCVTDAQALLEYDPASGARPPGRRPRLRKPPPPRSLMLEIAEHMARSGRTAGRPS